MRLYPTLGRKILIFQCLQENVKEEVCISPPPRCTCTDAASSILPAGEEPLPLSPLQIKAEVYPGCIHPRALIQIRSLPGANGACMPRLPCSIAAPSLFTLSYLGGKRSKTRAKPSPITTVT